MIRLCPNRRPCTGEGCYQQRRCAQDKVGASHQPAAAAAPPRETLPVARFGLLRHTPITED